MRSAVFADTPRVRLICNEEMPVFDWVTRYIARNKTVNGNLVDANMALAVNDV